MEQLTKAPVTLVDFSEESWYEVEVSRIDANDWYKRGTTFDSLRAANAFINSPFRADDFDYRIVRQTLRSEVVTADGAVE